MPNEIVRSHDFVRVADLGEMLGVSPVTIRGDLDVLAAGGEVRRIRVVVTNGLDVARLLAGGRAQVGVTGGTLAGEALLDPLAETVMERVNGDVAFVSCAGVDAVAGATDVSLPAAAVKRRMLLAAARRVVLVPAAGVGAVRTGAVCAVDDLDVLVTGAGAPAAALDALREAGVEVVVA